MSDQFSVNRIGTAQNNQEISYQAIQAQQNATIAANVKTVEQPEKKSETKEKSDEGRKQEHQALKQLNTVDMQFEVNRDTNEITLNIVDRETKEIIRTIPERSWSDLSVAELFKVTA